MNIGVIIYSCNLARYMVNTIDFASISIYIKAIRVARPARSIINVSTVV